MFCVIEFDKKECAIVPLDWLFDENSMCHWPRTRNEEAFVQLVQEKKEPRNSWLKYPVIKVYYMTESYEDAEMYLSKLITEQSSCSSDNNGKIGTDGLVLSRKAASGDDDGNRDDSCIRKDNPRSRRNSSSDDTSSEEDVTPMKKKKITSKALSMSQPISHGSISRTGRMAPSIGLVPSRKAASGDDDGNRDDSYTRKDNTRSRRNSSSDGTSSEEDVTPMKKKKITSRALSMSQPISHGSISRTERRTPSILISQHSTPRHTPSPRPSLSSVHSNSTSNISINNDVVLSTIPNEQSSSGETTLIGNRAFAEFVVKSLQQIQMDIRQSSQKMEEILRIQAQGGVALETPVDLPHFPLESKRQFKEAEAFLAKPNNFEYLKCRLACIGGSGVRSCVMNMLKFLLTNKLAMRFNWAGHEKKAFKTTSMMRVISEAARLSFRRSNRVAEDQQIHNAVKDWLKLAKARYEYSQKQASQM